MLARIDEVHRSYRRELVPWQPPGAALGCGERAARIRVERPEPRSAASIASSTGAASLGPVTARRTSAAPDCELERQERAALVLGPDQLPHVGRGLGAGTAARAGRRPAPPRSAPVSPSRRSQAARSSSDAPVRVQAIGSGTGSAMAQIVRSLPRPLKFLYNRAHPNQEETDAHLRDDLDAHAGGRADGQEQPAADQGGQPGAGADRRPGARTSGRRWAGSTS